jgi:hypothetical protein
MSFSAATCLSYTGTTILTNPITIYSNTDSYFSPFTSITLNQITSGNCPLILTGIPDGTTTLRLHSSNNYCCDILLECNDLCTTCDLGFNSYTSTTIGNIVAGSLTGSCDNPITDYLINWYGPSETASPRSTNIAAVSGFGTEFPDYNYPHPLTGTSALPMERGYYVPVIDKVRINGVDFSITGGTGYVPANLDCFDGIPVYVSGYTCDNGTEVGNYSHRVRFETDGGSRPPQALSSSFILSATTNFFAWKFQGEDVPDQLKLTFRGAAYGFEPIILDWWEVGSNLGNINQMQNQNVFPKSADTSTFISKVTTLTGLSVADDDTIKLEVIPSPTNNNTSWDFYFTCLETFTCDSCYDNYENESFKIIGSEVTGVTNSCNDSIFITIPFSGCNLNELNTTDLYKYYGTTNQNALFNNQASYPYTSSWGTGLLSFNSINCGYGSTSISYGNCTASNSYMSFTKDNSGVDGTGLIKMVFSGSSALTDFNKMYNSYLTNKNAFSGSSSNTDVSYYRFLQLKISDAVGDTPCGDDTGFYYYKIHHPTAVVSTGLTMGVYSLDITMPTITKGYFPTSCEQYCDAGVNWYVQNINSDSTGTSNNRVVINNVGSSYNDPFYGRSALSYNVNTSTGITQSSYYNINANSLYTIPASGTSNTLIPSLSGQVCDYSNHGILSIPDLSNNGYDNFKRYFFRHKVELINPLDLRDFNIYASPINNFVYSGYPGAVQYELAYTYSGGSIIYQNPDYVI